MPRTLKVSLLSVVLILVSGCDAAVDLLDMMEVKQAGHDLLPALPLLVFNLLGA